MAFATLAQRDVLLQTLIQKRQSAHAVDAMHNATWMTMMMIVMTGMMMITTGMMMITTGMMIMMGMTNPAKDNIMDVILLPFI
jgi:hypothetical protein